MARNEQNTSEYDKQHLSNSDYDQVQYWKDQYDIAKTAGDRAGMDYAHDMAEQIRSGYQYSGGSDGSEYNPWGGKGGGNNAPIDAVAPDWITNGTSSKDYPSKGSSNKKPYKKPGSNKRPNSGSSGSSGSSGGSSGRTEITRPDIGYVKPPEVERPEMVPLPDFSDLKEHYQGRESELRDMLEEWKKAAGEQQDNRIDYAVAQAVQELERALQDAQPQFKEQAESVARDERQAMDNAALYSSMRGDKGGIGQSQYNEVQAAAAQNRQAVQQAQVKLSTDTARQIADLRAQGEFEKADAALELAQNYLSQLMNLEKWAAEYNLSAAQFEASLKQWQAEYETAWRQYLADFDVSNGRWNAEFELGQKQWAAQFESSVEQWENEFNQSADQWEREFNESADRWDQEFEADRLDRENDQLISMGEAMLNAGLMPNDEQLAAMGMSRGQAQQYLNALQLEEESKRNPGKGSDDTPGRQPGSSGSGDDDRRPAAGGGNDYDGMNPYSFNVAGKGIQELIAQGNIAAAERQIAAIWGELNATQRDALNDLLNSYSKQPSNGGGDEDDDGMDDYSFSVAGKGIRELIARGDIEAAKRQIKAIWSRLNAEQKATLNGLLDTFERQSATSGTGKKPIHGTGPYTKYDMM